MSFTFSWFIFLYLMSGGLAVLVGLLAWKRKNTASRWLPWLMLAIGQWCLSLAFEVSAVSMEAKFLWSVVAYVGTLSVPVLLLIFALEYTRLESWLRPRWVAVWFIIPVVDYLLALTNNWHGWIWQDIQPTGYENIAQYIHGVWWLPGVIGYSYLCVLAATVLVIWSTFHYSRAYAKQSIAILMGVGVSWVGSLVYVMGVSPVPGFDFTPLSFAISGSIIFFAITRLRLMDLKPVARERVLESLLDGVIVIDASHRVVDLNPAARRIFRIEGQEPVGRSVSEVIEDWHHITDEGEHALSSREVVLHRTGGPLWLTVRTSLVPGHRREDDVRVFLITDITEQKLAEDALQESEERFRVLLQLSYSGLGMHENGKVLEVNTAMCELTGFSYDELLAMDGVDLVAPEFREQTRRHILEGYASLYEVIGLRKDGSRYPLEIRGRNTLFRGRRVRVTEFRDLTERKRWEQELLHRDALLQSIAAALQMLLEERDLHAALARSLERIGMAAGVDRVYYFEAKYDENGTGYASQRCEWNSGFAAPQIDNPVLQHLPFSLTPCFYAPLQEGLPYIAQVADIEGSELREILESQSIKSLAVFPILVRSVLHGYIGFDECRKPRVWTEAEISVLRAFANGVESAVERSLIETEREEQRVMAESANELKTRFLAMMSHEMRTPMNGILGFLDLLDRTTLTATQRQFVRDASTAAENLLHLISDILDFTRIGAGKLTIEDIPFSVHELAEEAVMLLAPRAQEKGLDLASIVDPEIPDLVRGDPSRLRQVLVNLLSNAVKFTPEGSVVLRLGLDQNDAGAHILHFVVEDTGIGIPESKLSGLFQPFMQLESSTTRRYGGSGLGLVISRELLHLMNGTIWVEPGTEHGTRFHVDLPVRIEPSLEATPEELAATVVLRMSSLVLRESVTAQCARWKIPVRVCTDVTHPPEDDPDSILIVDGRHVEDVVNAVEASPAWDRLIVLSSLHRQAEMPAMPDSALVLPLPPQSKDLWAALHGERNVHIPSLTQDDQSIDDIGPLSILVAEDNEINQRYLAAVLRRVGADTVFVTNGQQAIDAYRENRFDLILMDCQMPVMDGFEATRSIRSIEADGPRTRIVALTAGATDTDRQRCEEAGMDGFLGKPLRIEELHTLLRSIATAPPTLRQQRAQSMRELCERQHFSIEEAEELFDMFDATFPALMTDLERARQEKDFVDMARVAHQLAGAASNLHLDLLATWARTIEKSASDSDLDSLEHAFEQVLRYLK